MVLLILCMIIGAVIAMDRFADPIQMNAQDKIDQALYEHQAMDAVRMEHNFLAESFRQTGTDVVLYYSESTATRFTFRADNGELLTFVTLGTPSNETGDAGIQSEQQSKVTLTEQQLDEVALSHAARELGDAVFGQLQITDRNDQDNCIYYGISDYYNGIPTGTNVYLGVDLFGTLKICAPQVGTIFTRQEDGSVIMSSQAEMISQDDAETTALSAANEQAKGKEYENTLEVVSCELCGAGGTLYYEVMIEGYSYGYRAKTYIVKVNAVTGQVNSVLGSA